MAGNGRRTRIYSIFVSVLRTHLVIFRDGIRTSEMHEIVKMSEGFFWQTNLSDKIHKSTNCASGAERALARARRARGR